MGAMKHHFACPDCGDACRPCACDGPVDDRDTPPCGDAPTCDYCRRWNEALAKLDDAEADLRLLAPLHPDPAMRDAMWRMSSDLTGAAIRLAVMPWRHT